jgi:hypothetical protein
MFALSPTPIASEYIANKGQECKLGRFTVTVLSHTKDSRTGSYARGFKFGSNTYGYLRRQLAGSKYYKPVCYSPDHGVTWYDNFNDMLKQRAGKVKLNSTSSKEFAFDSIQKINKEYDQSYAWRP